MGTQNRIRSTETALPATIFGQVPPQAVEIERAVIGSVLLFSDAFDSVAGLIKPEVFYKQDHQTIYKAMVTLSENHQPVDYLTVIEQLRKSGQLEQVGGEYYISTLTNNVVSSANVIPHSRIILQKYISREIIRTAGELLTEAFDDKHDPFELLAKSETSLSELNSLTNFGDMVSIDKVLFNAFTDIQKNIEASKDNKGVTGVRSGFIEIDRATRGWQPGDLIYIGARPSVGKTAFALNLARHGAEDLKTKGGSVAIWSLEMRSVRLILRMIAAESGQYLSQIQTGMMDQNQLKNVFENGIKPLARLPIFFDDTTGLTLPKLKAKARKMKKKENLGLIVVDYLQLITGTDRAGTREQEISKISRGLKELAFELNIPIIALSQLSREVEKRAMPKPMLSDLRESGSIEQDADLVMFLWRPTESEIAADSTLEDTRYWEIAKQRDGYLVDGKLEFKDDIQKFQTDNSLPVPREPGSSWRPITGD